GLVFAPAEDVQSEFDLIFVADKIIAFSRDFHFFVVSAAPVFGCQKCWPAIEGIELSSAGFGLICKHGEFAEVTLPVRVSEFLKCPASYVGKVLFQMISRLAKKHFNQRLACGLWRWCLRRYCL